MTVTCREVITRALRMLGVDGTEGSPAPTPHNSVVIGLRGLKGLYLQFVMSGRFGPIRNLSVDEATEAMENERISDISGSGVTITFPVTVEDTVYDPVQGAVSTEDRAPRDRSVIIIEGGSTYIYDEGQTVDPWCEIEALTLDSEAPLGARFDNYLCALLAVMIAPECQVRPSDEVKGFAQAGRAAFRMKPPIRVNAETAVLRGLARC